MNELMIHIERIIRPVRAFQSRKLRMRRELLSHLQSAMDEERARGVEESAVFENATRRLGEPAELTRTFQQSVSLLERVLFARIPISRPIERLEQRSGKFFGLDGHLTMLHIALLVGAAVLVAMIATGLSAKPLIIDRSSWSTNTSWTNRLFLTIAWLTENGLFMLYCTFIGAMSAPTEQPKRRRRIRIVASIIVGLHVIWMVLICILFGAGRTISAGDWITGLGICAGALIVLSLFARVLAILRRPYDEWLMLDLNSVQC